MAFVLAAVFAIVLLFVDPVWIAVAIPVVLGQHVARAWRRALLQQGKDALNAMAATEQARNAEREHYVTVRSDLEERLREAQTRVTALADTLRTAREREARMIQLVTGLRTTHEMASRPVHKLLFAARGHINMAKATPNADPAEVEAREVVEMTCVIRNYAAEAAKLIRELDDGAAANQRATELEQAVCTGTPTTLGEVERMLDQFGTAIEKEARWFGEAPRLQ